MESNPVTNQVGATILFCKQLEQLIAHSQVVLSTFSAYFILEDVDWISREEFIRLL